jgi:hypothetical protein
MKDEQPKKKPSPAKRKSSDKNPDKVSAEVEFVQPKHTTCRDELASIPIECVASIAASMTAISTHEAIRRAYELLDIAAYVQGHLKDRMDHEEAIALHLSAVTNAPLRDLGKDMPPDISKIGKYEKCKMLPFKEILSSFWATGASGAGGIDKATAKEVRIRRWLQDKFNYDVATAIDELEKLKENGVPVELYRDMRFHIRFWWAERVRMDNQEHGSYGGRASAEKRKEKKSKNLRGRVTSNQDKRLGSKQTNLIKAINKTPSD